jgi:methionyl-tRNA formyltransferase
MENNGWRIIFMGTPDFAVPSLNALVENGENLVAVVTQPDRPKGRGRKLLPPPVKSRALELDLPVLQAAKIRGDDFKEQLADFKPDLIVVAAYGRILPEWILSLPSHGCINVHGSLLPKYRGAAPIQWALLNGDRESGVTIMQIDEGLDTGDMLLSEKLAIEDKDTSATLFSKLSKLGGQALIKALNGMRSNEIKPVKQDDSQATEAPLLEKSQGLINWSKSSFEISCQIRGLDPWPLAYTFLSKKRLKLFAPLVVEAEVTEEPGVICRVDNEGILIAAGSNYLLVKEIQTDGNRRMKVRDFLNGHKLVNGDRFGE